ncbi:MAG TPA: arylesterase [Candidatus Manganitrophaceae bacterium]|nr:arylesterase [Candidatus Manganitrophaceae bacterium]
MHKNFVFFLILVGWLFAGPAWTADRHPAAPASSERGEEPVLVAFGDSLTAGLGVSASEAYPAVLERKIQQGGYPYRVINAGVSGETTAGGLQRVGWILKSRPDIVILELGANDGLRGLEVRQTEKNLSMIIERLQSKNVRVVLAGMKLPPNYGKEYTEAFEKIYPSLARRYRLTLIPFFLDGVAAQSALNQADGIHPTPEGYQIIVGRLWPFVEPLLKNPPSQAR